MNKTFTIAALLAIASALKINEAEFAQIKDDEDVEIWIPEPQVY
jgi:hypothetical protein